MSVTTVVRVPRARHTTAAFGVSTAETTVSISPDTVPNNGTQATVSITLKDAAGTPIQGLTPPDVTMSGTNNTIGHFAASNSNGISSAVVSSTTAEAKTITVTAPTGRALGTVGLTVSGSNSNDVTSVTSVAPAVGDQVGGLAVTITVVGATVGPAPTVTFGGVAADDVTVVSTTVITCTTPTGSVGACNVVVGTKTLTNGYTYLNTPDIVNNASFEVGDSPSQWDGMTDWGSGTPSAAAPRTIGFDTAHHYAGASAVKMYLPTTSGSDLGTQFAKHFTACDRMYTRFYFYFDTGINGTMKFWIFEGGDPQFGGLYIFGTNLCWYFIDWTGSSGALVLADTSTLTGGWHSIEVDYWRNGHSSGYPAARFWRDGVPITTGTLPTGFGGTASWDNGYVLAGLRRNHESGQSWDPTATAQMTIAYSGVLNGTPNNTQASNLWWDRFAMSTLGRIGP